MSDQSSGKMHADEVEINAALVRRLLAAQFPQWANLPLKRVASAGTDHALYRLGDDLVMRLPRAASAGDQVAKEYRWLPQLAPHLPLNVPVPVALGQAGEGYPFQWTVCHWLPGENVSLDDHGDSIPMAKALANFVRTLHQLDPTGGPSPGAHNFGRGVPLADRDAETRAGIAAMAGMIDTRAALDAWEVALAAPAWDKPPVWIHGDLQAGNLLVHAGELSAVIDFGGMALGDPACDMMVAWNLLAGESRTAFRQGVQVDEATWARGRGWALSMSVIAIPYYIQTNPTLVNISQRALAAVLADHATG